MTAPASPSVALGAFTGLSPRQQAVRRLRQNRAAMLGAALLLAIVLMCFLLPLGLGLDPTRVDPAQHHRPPSWQHPFGTDNIGRDYLARVLIGGQTSLLVGLAATLASSTVGVLVGASAGLLSGVQDTIGPGGDGNNLDTETVLATLTDLRQEANSLDEIEDNQADYNTEVEKVAKIEEDLTTLDTHLSEFQSIEPNVLVSPFRSEAQSISTIQFKPADFFAPSVIVLLLQHLAITFAALSIVRERVNGAMELFRVSPISAIEMLISKYLSYIVFSGILAVILTLLVIYGLAVPMLGAWLSYGLVIAALIFTSLGIGFVISLLAQTDSQAVQYSMIVLLASVFFSGAFLALQTLWEPVRVVSWALPATYGILLLQNIMLRGHLADPILLGGLTAIGGGLFIVALWLLHRVMARS